MSPPVISIVMPVYNGANFIKQTLDSVFCQMEPGVEIIVINDGSQDDTVEIIQQNFVSYIQTTQLKLYTQQNQGVSSARNYGIDLAYGNYIGFMDADDLALPNYIKTLLSAIKKNVDIVEFAFKTFKDSVNEVQNKAALYSNYQFGEHAISNVIDQVYGTARWYPWSRIFKKQVLKDIRFPVGVGFCEDLMTIPKLYENAHTILVLRDAIYGYRINPDSATFKVKPSYVKSLITFYESIPDSGLIRHAYLRISVAFGIVSCLVKSENDWVLPKHIQKDLYGMRYSWPIYKNVQARKVAMLLYPTIFKFLKKCSQKSKLIFN